MRRVTVCVSVVLAVGLGACLAAAQETPRPGIAVQESVFTATIDRVDKWARTVMFRSGEGMVQVVYVPPELTIFDQLRSGDRVKVRFRDSYIVQVKPGAKLETVADTTAAARAQQASPDAQVQQQLTMTVRMESVDAASGYVTYLTQDGRRVARAVQDRRLLDGVRPGDVVTVTYTRERAVSVEHVR